VPSGHMAKVYQAFTEFYYARPFRAAKKAAKPGRKAAAKPSKARAKGPRS
jgi:hypothetical protein